MRTEQTYLLILFITLRLFQKDISELHSVKDDSTYYAIKYN
jgi:hypothetical protein